MSSQDRIKELCWKIRLYLSKSYRMLRKETQGLSENELFGVMGTVQRKKMPGWDFLMSKESNITADASHHLNARLKKRRWTTAWCMKASARDIGTAKTSLLGNSPHPSLVISESVWTCLGCMCSTNMQHRIEGIYGHCCCLWVAQRRTWLSAS